jgi:hypothetical protein
MFVEGLSAFYLATNTDLLEKTALLNGQPSGAQSPDENILRGPLPLPASSGDIRNPIVSLAGEWQFNAQPPSDFWAPTLDTSSWAAVAMPNELAMLGFRVTPNREYPLRKTMLIPAEYQNQRIFLRFDGVYGYARVWINGVFLRDHFGGFTSWDCEITDHVEPGQKAVLVIGVTDRSDDISQASYYAKHSIAGILRNVQLFAVPRIFLRELSTMPALDAQYRDGSLSVSAALNSGEFDSAELRFRLTDESGTEIPTRPDTVSFSPGSASTSAKVVVNAPKRWDAEHPNLFTLEVSLFIDMKQTETIRRKIGFRSIECAGNQLLVNGQPVNLRGVCRHSIHPTFGRAVPTAFDELDATLFRAANVNFVRTSHYPPSEEFLNACDRHGIYVEEETAVCWSAVEGGTASDSAFRNRFLSQFEEMVSRDRYHASVLFWSLGNESHWGENFVAEQQLAAESDPSRPTIFSFPDSAPLVPPFAIYSKHYPEVDSDLGNSSMPLLNDEYAHVSCYNLDTLRLDPGVREFWGQSIRQFGAKFLSADGCLGGSIWGGIDEVFLLPDGPVGYGPWGIIDGWRRLKPEYWLTKKAYSPIRIDDSGLELPEHGSTLSIPIGNAFDHTNLDELDIRWSCGSASGRVNAIDIPPHQSGSLEIPSQSWKRGDVVQLDFYLRDALIDQFHLPISPARPELPMPHASSAPTLTSNGDSLLIAGSHFAITFSQSTGLIDHAVFDGQTILTGGPYVDFGAGPLISHWLLRSCDATVDGAVVRVVTSGECKRGEGIESIPVEFECIIDGAGLITVRYRIAGEDHGNPRIGIAFLLPSAIEKLAWRRKALWSVYPDDHIGRPRGSAPKQLTHPAQSYGTKPEWEWSQDTDDAFLWGKTGSPLHQSNDFRSLKGNVYYAACILAESQIRARAEANADVAARASVQPDGQVAFSLYNYWSYPDLGWGNYTGPGAAPAGTTREVRIRLTDLPEEL